MEIQLSLLHLLFEDDRRAASHVGLDSNRICEKKKREKKKEKVLKAGKRDGIVRVAKCEVSTTILIKTTCVANAAAIIANNNALEESQECDGLRKEARNLYNLHSRQRDLCTSIITNQEFSSNYSSDTRLNYYRSLSVRTEVIDSLKNIFSSFERPSARSTQFVMNDLELNDLLTFVAQIAVDPAR